MAGNSTMNSSPSRNNSLKMNLRKTSHLTNSIMTIKTSDNIRIIDRTIGRIVINGLLIKNNKEVVTAW